MTPRLLLASLLLAAVVSLGAHADADLWWHLQAGREVLVHGVPTVDSWSYTAAGRPWINHEWLFGAMLAWIFDHLGTPGLLVFRFAWLALTIVAMATAVQHRTQHDNLTLALVGVPFPLIALLSNLRPQTATWALVPCAIVLLDRVWEGRKWAVVATVALVWLWVNLHGGFLFGWGLVGLGLLTAAAGLDGSRRRDALLAAIVLCVVPVFNVYGLDLIRYVAMEVTVGHPGLPEWNPPQGLLFGLVGLLILLPLALAANRTPMRWAVAIGFGVAAIATLRAAKFVQLLLLLAPVLLANQARLLWKKLIDLPDGDRVDRASRTTAATVVLVLLLGALGLRFTPSPSQITVDPDLYPVDALGWLTQQPTSHRLLLPLGWGGIAHYHLPNWKLSMDGRNTTVYEPAWVGAHTDAFATGDLSVLLRGDPEVALVRTDTPIDDALRTAGWTEAYRTPTATVWSRVPLQPAAPRALAPFGNERVLPAAQRPTP